MVFKPSSSITLGWSYLNSHIVLFSWVVCIFERKPWFRVYIEIHNFLHIMAPHIGQLTLSFHITIHRKYVWTLLLKEMKVKKIKNLELWESIPILMKGKRIESLAKILMKFSFIIPWTYTSRIASCSNCATTTMSSNDPCYESIATLKFMNNKNVSKYIYIYKFIYAITIIYIYHYYYLYMSSWHSTFKTYFIVLKTKCAKVFMWGIWKPCVGFTKIVT